MSHKFDTVRYCPNCRRPFRVWHGNAMFCCRNCRLRYYRAAKRAKLAGLPPESKHR